MKPLKTNQLGKFRKTLIFKGNDLIWISFIRSQIWVIETSLKTLGKHSLTIQSLGFINMTIKRFVCTDSPAVTRYVAPLVTIFS